MAIRIYSSPKKSTTTVDTRLVAQKKKEEVNNYWQSESIDRKFNFNLANIPLSSPHKLQRSTHSYNINTSGKTQFVRQKLTRAKILPQLTIEQLNILSHSSNDLVFNPKQNIWFEGKNYQSSGVVQQKNSAINIQKQKTDYGKDTTLAQGLKGDWKKSIDRLDNATDIEEIIPSAEIPGLSIAVHQKLVKLLKEGKRRESLKVLVDYLISDGQIDGSLLNKGKMYYSSSIGGEGLASEPGYDIEPQTGVKKARPTVVKIGRAAFRKGIPWLYTTVMHEYQHVLQFQEAVARGTKGQRSLGWLVERQEVEAYSQEIINSKTTGLFNQPKLMRESWRRLHKDHWLKLGKKSRKLLNKMYVQAHKIVREAVGSRVRLPFKPENS